MRKFILGSLALGFVALSHPVYAADMPVKAPPAVYTPTYDWSGFWVGVIAGGGWGDARQHDGTGFNTGWYGTSGGLVGLSWGTNWQFGHWVLGTQSDFSWSGIEGSTPGNALNLCGGAVPNCAVELRWFSTTRVRVGYAFDSWLPYVTAGLASANLKGREGDSFLNGAVGAGSKTRYGWTAGGGIEKMFGPRWTAKIEYLYADIGGGVFDDVGIGPVPVRQHIDTKTHIVRAGISYKFDWWNLFRHSVAANY